MRNGGSHVAGLAAVDRYPTHAATVVRIQRVWIAFAPENHASAAGIRKAGFTHVADLSFDHAGGVSFGERFVGAGPAVAALLGVPLSHDALSPCWRCARAAEAHPTCEAGTCQCDYQRPENECA